MGFTKIWEKYFLKEVFKTFFLFLGCFYGLYALIDYANHGRSFHQSHGLDHLKSFFIYYGCEFICRSEVLVPFAILLGTIRTLCKLNNNNELVAMMASGIKVSRLLRPFILCGFLFTALMYVNMQFILPAAANKQKLYDDSHTKRKNQKASVTVEHAILEDHSTLLFQNYDSVRDLFFDAYWIKSIDEIYKIKYLYPYTSPPIGYYVDHFSRNNQGELVLEDSKAVWHLPDLNFDAKRLIESLAQPESLSLTKLWSQLPENNVAKSEKEARLLSTYHRKLALPWLCLLAVLAPTPFCLRFSREFPTFIVYAGSLFGLIAVYIVLDAVHVLGRRQVVDPLYALWTPLLIFFLIFGWRFVRLR